MTKITWKEFVETGSLLYINQILQALGLSIAYEEDNLGEIIDVFPLKTDFIGYTEGEIESAYAKIKDHLKDTI